MQENDTTKVVRFPLFNRAGDVVGFTTIDEQDLSLVEDHLWHLSSSGHAVRRERRDGVGINIFMHQVILGIPSGIGTDIIQVDHKDRDRLNNRHSNLRVVPPGANPQNVGSYKGSTSKYRGVSWHDREAKWLAQAQINYKKYFLGYHDTELGAAKTASDFRREYMPYAIED